jgi:hypothetical protein
MYVRSTGRTAGSKYPLPPSGYNSDLKRQWAQKHLETLQSHIERFCNDYPYEITGEENIEAGIIVLKTIHPPILKAVDASLAFGDFICCLRSSLDHLAWQLAGLSGKRPGREVFFPIYEQNTIDVQVKIAKATFGIPDEAIALIKSFQPYHAGGDNKSTHLWRLNTLWSIDKHRHISAFSTMTTWQYCLRNGYREGKTLPIEQIDNCTIMTLPITYKGEVEFNPEVTSDLRFIDDFEDIDVGLKDLVEIYEYVANAVLPAFSRFFPDADVNAVHDPDHQADYVDE